MGNVLTVLSSHVTTCQGLPSPDSQSGSDVPTLQNKGNVKEGAAGGFRNGITVVSSFEGYAFDSGMRVGDKIVKINDVPIKEQTVDQVRCHVSRNALPPPPAA